MTWHSISYEHSPRSTKHGRNAQSSPPSPHDYRKMFKVLKGEMYGAKATFFFITLHLSPSGHKTWH